MAARQVPETAAAGILLYGVCGAVYLALAGLILLQGVRRGRISRTALLLAAAATATAAWSAASAWDWSAPLDGLAGGLDLFRALVWYGFVLHLFWRSLPAGAARWRRGPATIFAAIGVAAVLAVAAGLALPEAGAVAGTTAGTVSLTSPPVALRLGLAVCQLLLLENLYRATRDDLRWNVNLACVGLGGSAAYDLVLCADAALFHHASASLLAGRAIVAVLVCPLLAVAAARNRNWSVDIHVSRTAAFHSATLICSGLFLLAVAAAAALARRLGGFNGGHWGSVVQIGVVCAGILILAVLLTSGSARSLVRGRVIDHFFTSRYDYRREWLRCIDMLSGQSEAAQPGSRDADHVDLHQRVVRAVAQVVDSPAGMLLLREPGALALHWATSWNLPALTAPMAPEHPLLAALDHASGALELRAVGLSDPPGELWLAVPLRQAGRLAGCVLVAHPRAPFRLDREVLDLLRIVAHEVATYLAEQRATQVLLETRELRAYGERFAFVAHDIKNVSSQLSLLLSNAETHLANPDFQRDMLLTVGASVRKIGALLRRLQAPGEPEKGRPAADARPDQPSPGEFVIAERLERVAAQMRRLRWADIVLDCDDRAAGLAAAMDPAVFETIVTHLLDNAIEAAGVEQPVRLVVREAAGRARVDIVDRGPGMTPEFVRDQLFRPFSTSKRQGSGIGAFQARSLLRAAAGDLQVISSSGAGTTMRLMLPLAAGGIVAKPEIVPLSA